MPKIAPFARTPWTAARLPGDHSGRGLPVWLQERLLERRIVLMTGRLDEPKASEVAALLMTADAAGDKPIDVHLDSPDSSLDAVFVLIDTLDGLRAQVRVHCRGHVGGPAIGLVAAADHRLAMPHTRFRFGQPTAQFAGTPEQIASQSSQHQALLWRLYARLAHVTGRPAEEIAEDIRRGLCLDAREALDYGLIEEIGTG